MDNNKLKMGSVIGVGVLVSSLAIGTETSTYSTIFEPINTLSTDGIMLEEYDGYYIRNITRISFPMDLVTIGENIYEEDFPEIEPVEIPIIKKMVFPFKKPVKLEFS